MSQTGRSLIQCGMGRAHYLFGFRTSALRSSSNYLCTFRIYDMCLRTLIYSVWGGQTKHEKGRRGPSVSIVKVQVAMLIVSLETIHWCSLVDSVSMFRISIWKLQFAWINANLGKYSNSFLPMFDKYGQSKVFLLLWFNTAQRFAVGWGLIRMLTTFGLRGVSALPLGKPGRL